MVQTTRLMSGCNFIRLTYTFINNEVGLAL